MCAADAPEKSCVDLADEADRNGKVRQSRETMVHGGDVVDDLVDVARLMMSAEKVRLGREQILQRALAPFKIWLERTASFQTYMRTTGPGWAAFGSTRPVGQAPGLR